MLITEDASEDARFSANPYVAGAPFIKFYAGAPLVGRSEFGLALLLLLSLLPFAAAASGAAKLCACWGWPSHGCQPALPPAPAFCLTPRPST